MRHDRKNILVTRPLTGQQMEYARILGLEPVVEPALEFRFPEYWDETLRVINEHPRSDWVFTSTNGVEALSRLMKTGLQVRPEKQLYAVGSKTRQALQQLGLDADVPYIQDGKHLAQFIIDKGDGNSLIYFHGNLSRDEMTDLLSEANIEVVEVEVYKTKILPVSLPDELPDAILFYSPSAVEGFKQGEGFEDKLPLLFAIGSTTAAALQEETDQNVEVAAEPSTEALLRKVADYLFNQDKKEFG